MATPIFLGGLCARRARALNTEMGDQLVQSFTCNKACKQK
jgi:hypothetical protein